MLKKLLAGIMFLISLSSVFAGEWQKFLSLEYGEGNNQVGIDGLEYKTYASSIQSFKFDENENLFISDSENSRILKYSQSGVLIDTININSSFALGTYKIYCKNNQIYLMHPIDGLLSYNLNNNKINYVINRKDIKNFPNFKKGIHLYGTNVFYYPNPRMKKNDILQIIEKSGNFLDRDDSLIFLRQFDYSNLFSIEDLDENVRAQLVSELKVEINKNYFVIDENGRVYSNVIDDFKEYATILRTMKDKINNIRGQSPSIYSSIPYNIEGRVRKRNFLGYTNDFLNYWEISIGEEVDGKSIFSEYIMVFNQYGELIEKIKTGPFEIAEEINPVEGTSIDSTGNIFKMVLSYENGVHFYKYYREW